MPEPEQHPDLPPDGFDDGFVPDDVLPDDPGDDAPVNPESPEEQAGLPPLPSLEDGAQEEYGSYDPAEVRPESGGEQTLHDEDGNILPAFDPKHRQDFEGLLYLGALTKGFTWLGHKFRIRTLNVDELLAVTMVTQRFDPTMGAGLAYKTAMVAMTVISVDGKELPIPYAQEEDLEAWAIHRFEHVKTWFQFTIEAVYAQYLELETKATQVVLAMGKAPAQSASMTG